ncbi:hypothetical protein NDU88_006983 [Pleurodeles waltl]|uniref:Uncharacterized protein n=1 Tax=Pleurodeles waltl TaxID=8319 RepID=A0AAV7WC52_PLEWA|nr:hypothetical protein NDU88_006983 [Pleurodeles waltl]
MLPPGGTLEGVDDLNFNPDIHRTRGEKETGRRDEGEREEGMPRRDGAKNEEVNGCRQDEEEDEPTARRSAGEDVQPAVCQETEESEDPPPPGRQAEESRHVPGGMWLAQVHSYLPNSWSLM